jgi:hypothetical protein
MKQLTFITGLILIMTLSCRGPLAKPGDEKGTPDKKTGMNSTGAAHMRDPRAAKEDIKLEPAEGGITIAELLSDSKKYSGQTVRIKGKVTKVNPEIMGKNWIHLQDGTGTNDQYDITVTSAEVPATGDVVTFEGKITLDRDFGYGYTYKVLMEDAKIIK